MIGIVSLPLQHEPEYYRRSSGWYGTPPVLTVKENVRVSAEQKSVRPDHLVCIECGKHFSTLKRHLATVHQLTPKQYRQKWGLPVAYPIVAPNYTKIRSTLAKKIGLGRKGPKPARKSAVRLKR
jgi:predicted transcriptional regulator